MTEAKKYDIGVIIRTEFLPEHSDVEEDRYVFSYTIKISNTGTFASQLISRHAIFAFLDN